VSNYDSFTGPIKASLIERHHIIGCLQLCGRVPARWKMAKGAVGDVGSVAISRIGCIIAAPSERFSINTAEALALEEHAAGRNLAKRNEASGIAVGINRASHVGLKSKVVQAGTRGNVRPGGTVHRSVRCVRAVGRAAAI